MADMIPLASFILRKISPETSFSLCAAISSSHCPAVERVCCGSGDRKEKSRCELCGLGKYLKRSEDDAIACIACGHVANQGTKTILHNCEGKIMRMHFDLIDDCGLRYGQRFLVCTGCSEYKKKFSKDQCQKCGDYLVTTLTPSLVQSIESGTYESSTSTLTLKFRCISCGWKRLH